MGGIWTSDLGLWYNLLDFRREKGATAMLRRMIRILLWIVLLGACSTAQAKSYEMTAACGAVPEAGAVSAQVSGSDHTLYLPGNWDLSDVTITAGGLESFYAGDTLIVSGMPCDLTALTGAVQPMTDPVTGKQLGTLTVWHGSGIPSVFFTMDAAQLKKVNRDKSYEVTDGHVTYVEADGSVSYDAALTSFHGRGNSTYAYRKKPYQFKLDRKVSLSGLAEGKTWILLANYLDLSLLRNQIVLDLGREVGVPYGIGSQPVDVYMNGDYCGLYLLTEKIQIGKSRINITNLEARTEELNDRELTKYKRFSEPSRAFGIYKGYEIPHDPEDITGGYIFEIEKRSRLVDYERNGFETDLGLRIVIKEPTAASRKQLAYAANLFQDFHYALYAEDGYSPVTGRYYQDFIDEPSFVVKYLMEEFVKNYDFLASSHFMFKDSDLVDGKLYFGPLWDYDLCMGNIQINGFINGSNPDKEFLAVTHQTNDNLYWLLSRHEDFMSAVRREYWERLEPAARILLGEARPPEGSTLRSLDEYADAIAASAAMNFSIWPEGMVSGYYKGSGNTHDKSVAYLKDFIARRVAAMSAMWPEE